MCKQNKQLTLALKENRTEKNNPFNMWLSKLQKKKKMRNHIFGLNE